MIVNDAMSETRKTGDHETSSNTKPLEDILLDGKTTSKDTTRIASLQVTADFTETQSGQEKDNLNNRGDELDKPSSDKALSATENLTDIKTKTETESQHDKKSSARLQSEILRQNATLARNKTQLTPGDISDIQTSVDELLKFWQGNSSSLLSKNTYQLAKEVDGERRTNSSDTKRRIVSV